MEIHTPLLLKGLSRTCVKAKIFGRKNCYLEAVAFQVYEILLAMEKDSSQRLKALLVDGGMTKNDLLMQIQANFNGTFTY